MTYNSTLLNQCILGVTFQGNSFLYNLNLLSQVSDKNFLTISSLFVEIQNVKFMLYNMVFGCHGNICYVILINAFFLQCT